MSMEIKGNPVSRYCVTLVVSVVGMFVGSTAHSANSVVLSIVLGGHGLRRIKEAPR